jgi:zinc protease
MHAAVLGLALAALTAQAAGVPAGAAARPTEALDVSGVHGYVRPDGGAALAGVELIVRAGLDRQTASQNGLAALVAESVLRTPAGTPALPLADAVDARGASIGYALGAQSVRFYLEGPPAAVAAAAPLVAAALAAPSFEPATLTAARASLGERIADEDEDARLVGRAMLRASFYRGGAGLPAFGNATSLAAIVPADAKAFHDRWYVRGGAAVAAVGRTGDETAAASRTLAAALAEGSAPQAALAVRPPGTTPKRIVTHRDLVAPYVVVGFAAPSLAERDFAPALVMRALLTAVFDRPAATSKPPAFRDGGTIYGYDVAPGQMMVWINGARLEPQTGLAALSAVVQTAAAKPLSAAVLGRFKETARGEWTLETVSLDERARAIADAVTHGLPPDAADDVRAAIGRVTASDLQRVAKKYFQKFDVALILPRSQN